MRPFLGEHYGNPSSLHRAGIPAKDAAEPVRAQAAGLRAIFGDKVTLIDHPTERLPNTLDVDSVGRVGAVVLATLPGVAASTESACRAGWVTLCPVPAAVGVPSGEGMGAVRISLGRATTWEEPEDVPGMLKAAA